MVGLSDIGEFAKKLSEVAKNSPPDALAVVLIGSILAGGLGGWWLRRFVRVGQARGAGDAQCQKRLQQALHELDGLRDQLKAHQAVIDRMLTHEGQVWRMYPPSPPEGFRAPADCSHAKIVMVANNKGGVGKTTLVMYPAAYFAQQGKRVLAIDLDPQSSLTKAMLAIGDVTIPPGNGHRLAFVNELLSENGPAKWSPEVLRGQLENVHLVTCDQTLEAHETKLQLQWLAKGGKPDVRYHLARALLGEQVQNPQSGYHVVLIDAPPRLSLGAINALVASTDLLVPTKLDLISAETVSNYLQLVGDLRDGRDGGIGLNTGLRLAGVVGTMTVQKSLGEQLTPAEQEAMSVVNRGLAHWRGQPYMFKRDVQDHETIREAAGRRLVSGSRATAPRIFELLGRELAERIELK